jgi:hypothetical protein
MRFMVPNQPNVYLRPADEASAAADGTEEGDSVSVVCAFCLPSMYVLSLIPLSLRCSGSIAML